jgi:peptide/nickel transport system substrate-binding protein
MHEQELRTLIERVREGQLPRRQFVQHLVGLGLTAPMAAGLLTHAGVAQAQASAFVYKPTKRGGGGALKLLFWQGPTNLNPHFATGTKDSNACSLFYESLARWDAEGVLQPVLAAELPSRANGGISADGKTVTWKLKKGVTWHDGKPFTADDVVFNAQFAIDPAAATVRLGDFTGLRFEKVDTHTVRVTFPAPTPVWHGTYCNVNLVPKHLFAAYMGAKSREAPNNGQPVGTGPYLFVDFKPGDLVRGKLNPNYHLPNRPHFDTVEIKGGGDATSAARAVLQTGEYDFAWNLQVEDAILKRLEEAGKGRIVLSPGNSVEHILLNASDPNTEVDGERASPKSRHPIFSDPAVREAVALLIDRDSIQNYIYGRTGQATPNFLNNPQRYRSPNNKAEFNIDKANAVLDAAGWKRGAGGVREKGGKKLQFLFQTSINAPRQKTQAVIKQACQKAGIEIELKAVQGSVFFSSDVANPDTYGKFWADIEMFTWSAGSPDPAATMRNFTWAQACSQANKWQNNNRGRWRNDEYDAAFAAAEVELDPVKRAALFIRMNDLVCQDHYTLPLVLRPQVDGMATKLVGPISGWENSLVFIGDWYREA